MLNTPDYEVGGIRSEAEKVFELLYQSEAKPSHTVRRTRGIFIQANTVSHPEIVSRDTLVLTLY